MPTRSGIEGTETYVGNRIWREFQFGNLATLLMLETRLTNRSNGELDPFPDVDDDGDGVPDNEDPAATARLRAASLVSGMSPTQWSPNVLNDLRDGLERYRSMPGKTLLGQEQLDWLKARVEASKSAGTRWQLIGQQTVVLDSAHADIDQAIAAKSRTDINVSNLWAWQLHNVTGWDCSTPVICGSGSEHIKSYISLDPTAYRAQDYKKRKDVRSRQCRLRCTLFIDHHPHLLLHATITTRHTT
jgi:phosphodiesterase/alkaline phosphatase D-like protein